MPHCLKLMLYVKQESVDGRHILGQAITAQNWLNKTCKTCQKCK